jgi:HNH endonuclease
MPTAVTPTSTDTSCELAGLLDRMAVQLGEQARIVPGDHEQVLVAAERVTRVLCGLQARWLADASATGVIRRSGARNSAAWLEAITGASRRAAHRRIGLADAVTNIPPVGEAVLDGSLSDEQVESIQRAADTTKAPAERIERLIADVKNRSARDTSRYVRELERELVDETVEERFEQQRAKRSLSIGPASDGSGMVNLHASLDPLAGERIRGLILKAFKGLHRGEAETRSHRQLLADALEHVIVNPSGTAGGTARSSNVDVVVTVALADLYLDLNASGKIVGSAESIPIGELRRIACEHGLIPALLGSAGEVLDLGRRARLASPAQKKALKTTYGGCAVGGCDVPFELCQIHHIWQWRHGGPTNLDELVPLCTNDHHLVHDQGWTIDRQPDRTVTLKPP